MKPPDHPVPSGDRRVARLLLQALGHSGHQVQLASGFRSYEGGGDPERQQAIAAEGAAEAHRLIGRWSAAPAAERPELWFTYHVYHKAPDLLGPLVSASLRIPYVIAEPSHAPKQAGGPWSEGYRRAAGAIAAADALFCLTRHDMACVADLARPGRLHFLPPFLDATPFAAAMADRTAARAQLADAAPLDPAQPWLLAVAMMRRRDKLDSYRELAVALQGLADLPWQLLIVGDGEARDAVAAAFATMAGRVFYLGTRAPAALPAIYAAGDLYVWPAVGEAYGMALLEAAATGLPVVAGRLRGVPDVVEDGSTGLLCRPGDPADFAAKVRRLLTEPGLRRQLGTTAARFVAEQRSLAAAAGQLDQVLTRLQPGRAA